MHFVYILRSEVSPEHFYVGATTDLDRRIREHNEGMSVHTDKYRPWKLATYIAFADRAKALRFESYLKSGSGRAFAKKHL